MKKILAVVAALIYISNIALAAPTDDTYQLGPDSLPQAGVPHGQLIGPLILASNVYPNTTRSYWIYVPAQYDPKVPAALMVFFDGHAFIGPGGDYRVPNVFDNLIYRREMPITIGVFVNPGNTPQQKPTSDQDWGDDINNRGIEYNALDDTYTKLVANELLPAVEKDYNISPDPDMHAIGGASSGAICAFTVAWHRPDLFHKVISMIGSFTNIRGGDAYPDMISQAKTKPLRVFLQDGVNDNRGMRGNPPIYDPRWDWHAQNIRMLQALTAKHYDVNFVWGIGTHSGRQGGAIMPDMLRWIWRDYPRTDDPHDSSNRTLFVPANQQ
jgi:enterochelin esterase-like enzyme